MSNLQDVSRLFQHFDQFTKKIEAETILHRMKWNPL